MKCNKMLFAGLLLLPVIFCMQVTAGCEAKRQDIEKQLTSAKSNGNSNRVVALEKALSELNTNCTDEELRARRESKVYKKDRKVEERQRELINVGTDDRVDKINKKQRKLAEAQAELEEAKSMLNK